MLAAYYTEKHDIEVRQTSTPLIGQEDVLLKVMNCGVCGTDIVKVTQHLVNPPIILGHEVSGLIEQVGAMVTKFKKGDRVVVAHHTPCYACHYCLHDNVSMCKTFKSSNLDPGGFAQYLRIPAMHVHMTTHLIPEHLTYAQAVFMEPLACIVRNVHRAKLKRADWVLVFGLGSVGLMTGMLLKAYGHNVIGVDLLDSRIKLAKDNGFDQTLKSDPQNIQSTVSALTQGRGVDLLILTAGNASVYSSSIEYVRDGGAISIFASLPEGQKISFDVMQLYKREITIYSSYSPSPLDLKESLDLIASDKVDVSKLNPTHYPLNQTHKAFEDVVQQKIYKAIIEPNN